MSVPKSIAVLAGLLLVIAACGTGADSSDEPEPGSSTTSTSAAVEAATTTTTQATETTVADTTTTVVADGAARFLALVNSGEITAEIDSPEGGVSGNLLDLGLTNTTQDPIEATIPCGLVFVPDDFVEPPGPGEEPSGSQRMINLTPIDVALDPDGSITATPFVMCIDSSNAAPGPGAVYSVGELATDELLALAECICEKDLLTELGPLADVEIQMAVWAASEGTLPDAELTEADGALRDVMGGELDIDPSALEALSELEGLDLSGIDLGALGLEDFDLEAMLEQAQSFLESYTKGVEEIFSQCDIDFGR